MKTNMDEKQFRVIIDFMCFFVVVVFVVLFCGSWLIVFDMLFDSFQASLFRNRWQNKYLLSTLLYWKRIDWLSSLKGCEMDYGYYYVFFSILFFYSLSCNSIRIFHFHAFRNFSLFYMSIVVFIHQEQTNEKPIQFTNVIRKQPRKFISDGVQNIQLNHENDRVHTERTD